MPSSLPFLHIALPVMDETEALPAFLECYRSQTYKNRRLYTCVNQPETWWNITEKQATCERNEQTLTFLRGIKDLDIVIIDRSSRGNGWKGKRHGVGWARKTVMDDAARQSADEDIIISLDADTVFPKDYFETLAENFARHPGAVAMAVPYYHRLTGNKEADRAILRYEIYMRYYTINLWRIGCPYSFTALGSAISLPVKAYKAIKGISPEKSGEDFYFLQRLRKYGDVLFWNERKVYPAARFSDRVFFGTGPAMIKGRDGDWESYPIYAYRFFDEIMQTYVLFPFLYEREDETPMTAFLRMKFREDDPLQALRENFKEVNQFVRACHKKVDGLRVLQYLKWRNGNEPTSDEKNIEEFLNVFYPGNNLTTIFNNNEWTFNSLSIEELNTIRDFLAAEEEKCQLTSIPR